VGVKLGYQLTLHFRATGGYDFLFWNNVVRREGQIDTAINPNLLPPPLVGPNRPAPLLSTSDVWVQGISFELEFRY
jgi:Putative beta barrel porin-7 (BBP7)